MKSELPPCGVYKTTVPIGEVPAGRLVYFHNHGEPGPGVYLPRDWSANRARFHAEGHVLPSPDLARTLRPLSAEGLYRVAEAFHCCERRCRLFEIDELVQLGYDGEARPILFTPELGDAGLTLPERGTRVDAARLEKLRPLKVAAPERADSEAPPFDPGNIH